MLAEVTAWQQRPLDPCYPVVIFDCLRVKIRDEGAVRNKAVYLALGIRSDGCKEVLGLWIEQTEGAAFWHRVMTELANRSLHMQLRKVIKTRGRFPTDDAATKLLYLAPRNIMAKWKTAAREWRVALPHFAILFGDRFTMPTE